jgi:DNA-binding protein
MKMPLAPFRAYLRENGAEKVSAESVEELRKVVEEFTSAVAERSVFCMKHANRKTVYARDIRLSVR